MVRGAGPGTLPLALVSFVGAALSPTDDNANPRSRRKHRRVPARELVAEVKAGRATSTWTVSNVSMGGVLLSGGKSLPLGELLELELRFKGTPSVRLQGRSLYEIPVGVGVSFEPMSLELAASLEKLIAAVDAKTAMPPPLPPGRAPKEEELPPPSLKPGEDPFGELPDPRPPRSGLPDERAEYLRALVKNRDESLKRGRASVAALIAETEALRAAATRFKAKMEAVSQQQALTEASLAGARQLAEKHALAHAEERKAGEARLEAAREEARRVAEQHQKAQREERRVAESRLEDEQRRTLEAIAAVSGLEAKLRRHEADAAKAREELEKAVREAKAAANEAAAVRKAREELALANRKAMEAQSALNKERNGRLAAEKALSETRAALEPLQEQNKKLAEDYARLKARLVAAERALDSRPAVKKPAGPPVRGPTRG